jgi:hypothetical protein
MTNNPYAQQEAIEAMEWNLENPNLSEAHRASLECEIEQAKKGHFSSAWIGESPKESTELY